MLGWYIVLSWYYKRLSKGETIRKLICLIAIVGILSFIPTPPIGQKALADSKQPRTISSLPIKTKPIEAVQATKTTVAVQTTVPTQSPATAPSTQPTQPITHESMMAAAGIAPSDYNYVDYIISHESEWCSTKWQGQTVCPDSYQPTYSLNNGNKGYGICQSTPGIKMSAEGGNYLNDPVLQLKWCVSHMQDSYGSWEIAYYHWVNNKNW